jgi:hypothetical protein
MDHLPALCITHVSVNSKDQLRQVFDPRKQPDYSCPRDATDRLNRMEDKMDDREPDATEKEKLLKEVLSMFENLSTSYIKDIEDIAEGAR